MEGLFADLGADRAATLLILVSALLHATFSAVIKKGGDRLAVITLSAIVSGALCLPVAVFLPLPAQALWLWLGLSVVVHSAYFLFLARSYRLGDLSIVYPVARGTAPLLTALGAVVIFGEHLNPAQIGGILLISLGIGALAWSAGRKPVDGNPGATALKYALATGVLISVYTLIDAKGVRAGSNPFIFIVWMFLLNGAVFPLVVFLRRGREFTASLRQELHGGLFTGIAALLSYGMALLALSLGGVAEIAALRETSVLFAALIGAVFLGEVFSRIRILAALVVAFGAVSLRLFG